MRINGRWRLALAAVLLAILLAAGAQAQETVLRVAFPQAEGFSTYATDGGRQGLVVDYLNEIAKYTGWRYEYVPVSSDEVVDDFIAGKFDLMGGTFYAQGFEAYFAYPDYNCGYSHCALIARKDDTGIKRHDLRTLNGKTIGVFERNEENIRRMKEYLSFNNLDCDIRSYSYDEMLAAGGLEHFLQNGEVDLLLQSSVKTDEEFRVIATFVSQPHYIVAQPDNQAVLEGLNMALANIYESDPDFASKVYEDNFSAEISGYIALNTGELAYIEEKKRVSVAVPRDWHPLLCLNNDDQHEGIVSDVLSRVSDYSGLEFEYVYSDSYAQALEMVQVGKADMLAFFLGTEEDAQSRGLARSAAYVNMDAILVRNKESGYPAQGLVGAILEGWTMPSCVMAEQIRYYSDIKDALSDVNQGKAHFFYGLSSHLEYLIQRGNFTNLVQVSLINNSLDIGFALPTPVCTQLLTIVNKAINNMTEEEKLAITSRNVVSIGEARMSLAGIVYANPTLAVSVVAAFLLLILAIVVLVYQSRLRGAAMRGELQKAEADSRAKSAFLSRMSHEIRTPMNAIVGLADLTDMLEGLPDKAKENLAKIKSSSRYLLDLISDILDMSRIESGRLELAQEPFSLGAMLADLKSMMSAEAARRSLTFSLEQDVQSDALTGDAIRLRQVMVNLLSNAFKFTPAGGSVRLCVTQDGAGMADAVFTFRVIDSGIGIAPQDQKRIFSSFEQVGPNIAKSQGTGLGLAISSQIVRLMGGELKVSSQPGKGSEFSFSLALPKAPGALKRDAGEAAGDHRLKGMRILMAEDNDLNAQITTELLQLQGAQVTRAENGEVAVALFAKSPPGAFQAVLMDVLMPKMNGLEATRAIRALTRPDARCVPIVAMTANAFKEDQAAAMAAGMTGFIPKPIDVNKLYHTLEEIFSQTESAQ